MAATTCTDCGRTWTGYNQAHCRLCHAHFSTVSHFDRHQPSYDGCKNPAELTNKHGVAVLYAHEGPFGITWTGIDTRKDSENGSVAA